MRYHIDTIPVWDAHKSGAACLFCALVRDTQERVLEGVLGGAAMEPARRLETNREGFCPQHFEGLIAKKEKLPLALVLHTHLQDVQTTLAAQEKALAEAARRDAQRPAAGRAAAGLLHRGPGAEGARAAAQALLARAGTCHVCRRVDEAIERYLYTLCMMWANEPDFRAAFTASGRICLPHAAALLRTAADCISGEDLRTLCAQALAIVCQTAEEEQKSLFHFTQKFDYKNRDLPWGDSKTAPERAQRLLRGGVQPQGQEE